MALIHHDHGVVLFCKFTDAVHGSHIAVHGKDPVGDDDAETLVLGRLQLLFQVLHVGIFIAVTLGLAKPDPVDYGGMVERIGNYGILGC